MVRPAPSSRRRLAWPLSLLLGCHPAASEPGLVVHEAVDGPRDDAVDGSRDDATTATRSSHGARSSEAPSPTAPSPLAANGSAHRVSQLSITILSTSRAPRGTGEWGFAALVEADGARILFDTGAGRKTVLHNAEALRLDLSTVPTVVLSHHHGDHVGGLLALRRAHAAASPEALHTVHVARGIFEPRRRPGQERDVNELLAIRPAFEATGGRFIEHEGPAEIAPGVWITGPVPRVHDERNWSGTRMIPSADGWTEDVLPESQALVVDTEQGLVVLSGCGHAGIVNIVTHARASIRSAPVVAAVGGMHLHKASASHLSWTAEQLGEVGLHEVAGAHCTGSRAVQRFGALPGVGSPRSRELGVGERYVLGEPAEP